MQHNFRNFNEILNRYKIINIPYYQRDYVWGTKNDGRNLFKFIDDIFTAYDTTTASSYFIGTLAFCSDRVNDVIDGQQRITSLILVLSALANKCSTEFFKKNESLLFPYGDDRFVLQENEYLTEEIKNALDYSNNFNTQGYKVDISKTLDKINSQINNAWGGRTENWYDGLYNYILNNVNFISLEYTNIGDSLKYFLNINSLSIQLTQSDIFYSILSQSLRITSNIHTIFEIKQRISKLSELRGLGESIEGYKCYDGNRNVDNVIYIFLKSYYQNDKNIQAFEETGIGKWLSFYKNEVFNDQLKAKNFIDKFLSYLDDFEFISRYFSNYSTTLKSETASYMAWVLLQYEGYKDFLKMLFEIFRKRHNYIDGQPNLYVVGTKNIDKSKLDEIGKRLNLTLLWNYIRSSNKRLDSFVTNISIESNGDYVETIDNIKGNINIRNMFNLNYNDKKNVSDVKIRDDSRIIKVIFAFQEAFLNYTARPEKNFNEFLQNLLHSDKFSIEHLLSVKEWTDKTRLEKWKQQSCFTDETNFDTERFKFENLSLLDKRTNSSAGDDEIYDKLSKYKSAKEVCDSDWEYLIQSLADASEFYNNQNIQALNLPERKLIINQNTWKHSQNNQNFNIDLMKLVLDYVANM